MKHYTIIENASGLLWWAGEAESPELAAVAALDSTGDTGTLAEMGRPSFCNESGFHVYETPSHAVLRDLTADDYEVVENDEPVAYFLNASHTAYAG